MYLAAAGSPYLADRYSIVPNPTHSTANGWNGRLERLSSATHSWWWIKGSKEESILYLSPYLEMNWTVINVKYRLGHIALAPAAVEHYRCALYTIENADLYKFDLYKSSNAVTWPGPTDA
jgi:hypothetical protein